LKGFLDFLADRPTLFEDPALCYLDFRDYYSPAYYTMLASALIHARYIQRYFDCHKKGASYLNTIGFISSVFGTQTNPVNRISAGHTYSPLVKLSSQADVDTATGTINNCIRSFANQNSNIARLYHVVGELHDNVWAHGNSAGFSMAQKWKVPNEHDYYLEFAVADSGLGFLAELKAARIQVANHKEAIEWCIKEGNSSKLVTDEFAQSIPSDFLGNVPSSHTVQYRTDGSNHQGLGLYHLIALVYEFNGELHIFSGNCRLHIRDGVSTYYYTSTPWQGVAISCRFRESCLNMPLESAPDDELSQIINDLL